MRRAARALELTAPSVLVLVTHSLTESPVSDPPALVGRYKIRVGTGP